MLKRISFTLVFLSIVAICGAQSSGGENTTSSESAKNNVYLEFFGKGLFYSFNYEREIYRVNDNLAFNGSIGIAIMNGFTDTDKSKDRLFPFEINAKYSFGSHHIVFGYGTTLWKYKVIDIKIDNSNVGQAPASPTLRPTKEWFAHLVLEYRYQKPEGGLMLKGGISPLFFDAMSYSAFNKNSNAQFSINIGAGWSF